MSGLRPALRFEVGSGLRPEIVKYLNNYSSLWLAEGQKYHFDLAVNTVLATEAPKER